MADGELPELELVNDSETSESWVKEQAESTTTSETSSSVVVSLLDCLKAPKNLSCQEKENFLQGKRPSCSSNPKSVSLAGGHKMGFCHLNIWTSGCFQEYCHS